MQRDCTRLFFILLFIPGNNEGAEGGGGLHVLKAGLDDLLHLGFDLDKIELYGFGGDIVYFGDGFPGGLVVLGGLVIDDDVCMEGLEAEGLAGTVGGDADEFPGGKGGDAAGGNGEVEVLAFAGAGILAVGTDGGLGLEDLADLLGDETRGVATDLAAKEIGGEVEEDVGGVAAIEGAELFDGLDAEGDGDFIGAGGGEGGVHAGAIKGGELIAQNVAGYAAFFIDELEHAGDIKADDGAVNVLFPGVGPDADDLGGMGVVEVEGEFIGGEQVI